jgi:hypothetical protein
MNLRAHDLVVVHRGVLGMLPGANAIGFHTVGAGAYLLIMTSTNAAVQRLGYDLGLGAPEFRSTHAARWLCAQSASTSEHGTLSIAVIGPHRRPAPSGR